ncbi:hypothetical protein [Desertivirga arenae]|uniref:hypothetical protein n=1 Tax=Desertivirga arenae TaxID=2810309 RepID=UPI001A96E4CE|nr:hypothetical protein [Pedobacter sp. SYSU D00823]
MKLFSTTALLSFLFSVSFFHVFGQQVDRKDPALRFLVRGGLDFGGDKVADIDFEDGSKQSVPAGQGGWIAGGAEYQVPAIKRLLFHATVGYKYVTTKADNAHIRLTRVPLQFAANFMATKKLRVGAGVMSHQAVRFKAQGFADDLTLRSTTGPTFELAYGALGVTYTSLNYRDQTDEKYSASSLGVSLTLAFPKR